ncbi:MAG: Zn-dependent hydrolase [Alicyclobacillaceae bacterium]|nr:Zn-dependent hydrolase [Alicyclobacillaceae bacterium]
MASVDRLWQDLHDLGQIGREAGRGITRLAFSDEDEQAKSWVVERFQKEGLHVRRDAFGNLFARREGRMSAPAVAVGSHLDTVVSGGMFDGALGVLAALEVVRSWNEQGIETRLPLEIIVFAAEESARFGVSNLGSKVVCGKIGLDRLRSLRDRDGVSLAEAMKRQGLDLEQVHSCVRRPGEWHSFVEFHIEQGPELEETGATVGIVTGISAPTRFRVTVEGKALHSGTASMTRRRDALVAAAQLVEAVEAVALVERDEWLVGTVGVLDVFPGTVNTIPGRVQMRGEFRSTSSRAKDLALKRFQDCCEEVRKSRGVTVDLEVLQRDEPVDLDGELIGRLRRICEDRGVTYRLMPSGAGHDAMNMASMCPTAMIFVPSRAGISHHPDEWTNKEDLAAGLDVLEQFLAETAGAEREERTCRSIFMWPGSYRTNG